MKIIQTAILGCLALFGLSFVPAQALVASNVTLTPAESAQIPLNTDVYLHATTTWTLGDEDTDECMGMDTSLQNDDGYIGAFPVFVGAFLQFGVMNNQCTLTSSSNRVFDVAGTYYIGITPYQKWLDPTHPERVNDINYYQPYTNNNGAGEVSHTFTVTDP